MGATGIKGQAVCAERECWDPEIIFKRTAGTKFFNPFSAENCIIYKDYVKSLSQDKAVAD